MSLPSFIKSYRWTAFALAGASLLLPLQSVRANRAQNINIVGLDSNGRPTAMEISPGNFSQTIATVVTSVQSSIEPALVLHEDAAPVSPYELRTVSVGTTISGSLGLGPIWSIGGIARLRLVFSNSTNPVYPD